MIRVMVCAYAARGYRQTWPMTAVVGHELPPPRQGGHVLGAGTVPCTGNSQMAVGAHFPAVPGGVGQAAGLARLEVWVPQDMIGRLVAVLRAGGGAETS